MITLGLIDDHVITRKGIKTVLELQEDIQVILEAKNGEELLQILKDAPQLPSVLILDINMPTMNGISTIDAVKELYPSIQILIFTLLDEEDAVINMITRGASGYLPKSADPAILVLAVRQIVECGFYLGLLVKKEYFRRQLDPKRNQGFYGKEFLSSRELEYIKLAATNLTYSEIAKNMDVRPKTLENYRDSVFLKLGINNRAALAIYALKNGLL